MERLLVALVVAAAVLWAVLRVRRTVRGAARATSACASCPVADRCDPAASADACGTDRTGPPR
jgi:hypothetical protein